MNITNYVAVAVAIMLAGIVYEFIVISRFIAKQKLEQQDEGEWRRRLFG